MYRFGAIRSAQPLSPRPLGQGLIKQVYDDGQTEPPLSEVLSDPIVHAVMARDSVTLETLTGHIEGAQKALTSDDAQSDFSGLRRQAA